jgi:hypothetical protein
MRSREITVGRAAKDHMVDVDLTLEVPLHEIERPSKNYISFVLLLLSSLL